MPKASEAYQSLPLRHLPRRFCFGADVIVFASELVFRPPVEMEVRSAIVTCTKSDLVDVAAKRLWTGDDDHYNLEPFLACRCAVLNRRHFVFRTQCLCSLSDRLFEALFHL